MSELSAEELEQAIEKSKSMEPIFRAAIERRDADFIAYMNGKRESGSDKAFSSYHDRHILLTLLREAEAALRTAQERVAALEGALRFYANQNHFLHVEEDEASPLVLLLDDGVVAQKALEAAAEAPIDGRQPDA